MESNKWADRKVLMNYLMEKQVSSLGPKPEKGAKREKKNKMSTEEKKAVK